MRYEERVRSEMKQQAAGQGHSMSSYRKDDASAFPFRSDCETCGEYIELGFGQGGERSFAPRGRAPFERCAGRRGRKARRVTT